MNIFEIMNSIEQIVNAVSIVADPETGEVAEMDIDTEGKIEMLQALEMAKDEKIRQLIMVAKNMNAEIESLDKIAKEFSARLGKAKKKLASVQDLIRYATNGEKFSCTEGTASWRKTTSTDIREADFFAWCGQDDEQMSAEDKVRTFTRHKETWEPDKKAIAKYIDNGMLIPGCVREDHYNIKIG